MPRPVFSLASVGATATEAIKLRVVAVSPQGYAIVCVKKKAGTHPLHNSNHYHQLSRECCYGRFEVAVSWSSYLSVPSKSLNAGFLSLTFRCNSTCRG